MKYIKNIEDNYTVDELKHTIFRGDNRKVLKSFPNECVDLVYIDPPFFSGRKYTVSAHKGEITTYSDIYADNDTYIDTIYASLVEIHRVLKNTGSIYLHCDYRTSHKLRLLLDKIFGEENFKNEIIWSYKTGGTSKSHFSRKHDTIFFYSKTKNYTFNFKKEKSYLTHKYGFKNVEILEDQHGFYTNVGIRDVWDISALRGNQPESLGFKTQKPMELLKRIINASSNKGDIVLDCFMGTGTTLDAAYVCNRTPIGIDMGLLQINIALKRCKQNHIKKAEPLKIIGMTGKDIEDYKILSKNVEKTKEWDDRRFERFVVMLMGGTWTGGVGDGNVDGRMPNGDIIQVKQSESVGPGEIQKLSGTLDSENQVHGILVAYSFTSGVKPEIKGIVKNTKHKSFETLRIDKLIDNAKAISDINDEIETIRKKIEQEIEDDKLQLSLDDF